ncbi:MAG TPA: chromosome partition protein MukE [Polyangiaceae bacterium]|nr:chromosome partition protein MukE [Polyangiaceae bacterium]
MTATKFLTLGDAVQDEHFPDVDSALRRGRHIDRDDTSWFGFLADAADMLEPFYRRFGAELVYRADGYYYLLPTGDRLAKRYLSVAEMLVGQALTLLYLDPATVEQGGRVRRDQVLGHLATVMGTDALVRALNPKRRRYDERVAQETVRTRVADALRRLGALGFVEALGAEELKLRPALLRFAEPVRASADSTAALSKLVASGELALMPLDAVPEAGEGEFEEETAPFGVAHGGDDVETERAETYGDASPRAETDGDVNERAETHPGAPEADAPNADTPDADAADTPDADAPDGELSEVLRGFDPSEFDDFDFEDVKRDPPAELPDDTALEEPE